MEEIFESECNPELVVLAHRLESGNVGLRYGSRDESHLFGSFVMVKEDAEAMARAILGIPDPPVFDWEQCVADMRAQVALDAIDEARARRTSVPA